MPRIFFPSSRSLTNFFFFFFFFLLVPVSPQIPCSLSVTSTIGKDVPAMFVFGDSFLDNGNNLRLKNPSVHFDFLPYGVDFPKGPTGRLTNGRNPADLLGQMLGIHDFLPAALDPETKGKRVLGGVNYASGGSGILEMNCEHSKCLSVAQQIKIFEEVTLPDLRSQLSSSQVSELLLKSIFLFSSGGNDCYKTCIKSTESRYCVSDESLHSLVEDYIQQIKNLYDLGTRKFVLIGLQQLGCMPYAREKEGTRSGRLNEAAVLFNARLRSSIDRMKQVMPGSHVVVVNTYNIIGAILDDPAAAGFKVVKESCCALSAATAQEMCEKGGSPCLERDSYLYFDGVHLTEAGYKQLVERAYFSELQEIVYPYSIGHLAHVIGLQFPPASLSLEEIR